MIFNLHCRATSRCNETCRTVEVIQPSPRTRARWVEARGGGAGAGEPGARRPLACGAPPVAHPQSPGCKPGVSTISRTASGRGVDRCRLAKEPHREKTLIILQIAQSLAARWLLLRQRRTPRRTAQERPRPRLKRMPPVRPCRGSPFLERFRDRGIVDLSGAWFATAGHIGNLNLPDERVSASEQRDQVPFTDLGVIEVRHHSQPWPIYASTSASVS